MPPFIIRCVKAQPALRMVNKRETSSRRRLISVLQNKEHIEWPSHTAQLVMKRNIIKHLSGGQMSIYWFVKAPKVFGRLIKIEYKRLEARLSN